jgi:hypothetical protein
LLFAVALVTPVYVHAQADNDAARIAVQKRNLKQSQKQVRARNRAMRKAQRSMGKPVHVRHTDHKGKTP